MIEKINNYLDNKEFKLSLYKDKLHIMNYVKLITLEKTYISIMTKESKIIIKGMNLSLKKILDHELLVKGIIKNIEVSNEK